MAALEASFALTASLYTSSSSTKFVSLTKTRHPNSIKLAAPIHLPHSHSLNSLLRSPISLAPTTRLCFSVQEIALEDEPKSESIADSDNPNKKKLYMANLPWTLSVVDIKTIFGQHGTVVDVEIIKQKDGRSRGFAFVTMDSGEEAQAVIDNFNLKDLSGRIIKVEFAKRFKKPSPPRPPGAVPRDTRFKLYVTNIEWNARSTHLRDLLLAENFKPVSTRVIFDGPNGRSHGFGFISFATKEEAEAALSSLNGKELMGRPLRIKLSEKTSSGSGKQKGEEETINGEEETLKGEEETINGEEETLKGEEEIEEGQIEES